MENQKTEQNLNELFYEGLIKQIRAIDSFGSFKNLTDEELVISKFVTSDMGDMPKMDQMTMNIKLYLQALAITLDRITGHIIGLMTESSCDGSVKALFYSGQLVLMDKTFGGINGLQFGNLEKLKESGGKLLTRLQNIVADKDEKFNELLG